LGEFQETDLGEAGHQGKVEVLQAFLVGKRRGFEPLAQLLFLTLSQLPFEQGLQVPQIA
jgi:hypothetical protein